MSSKLATDAANLRLSPAQSPGAGVNGVELPRTRSCSLDSPDRYLILGVLGVQAGFVTPTQVMTAASVWLVERDGPALLSRLEQAGALTSARRRLLEAMADEAIAASGGDGRRVLDRLGGDRAIVSTFGDAQLPDSPTRRAIADAERSVPDERPGQYTRLGELGRGGQSVVQRAVDEFVGREVALKELSPPPSGCSSDRSASERAVRGRFLREVRLTAQLDHPGIVAVHELARRPDGALFCAQKLVRGETLKARLARCPSLAERLGLLEHLIDACHAVAYAHSRGVIHRDLKPSNIMVGGFGETVVVDWGLAKRRDDDEPEETSTALAPTLELALTAAGSALGTPAYMSPEQARGAVADIDERSDVFGLGVILYELLTGRLPFEGANAEQVIDKVRQGRFPPVRGLCPEAPAELAAVAERALSAEPRRRYDGARLLAMELTAYRAGARVMAYDYGSWALLRKFVARNRALTAVSACALLVLIAASVVVGLHLHVARLQLAASFLERARAAEQSSDWGRAAGYYAASRVHRDSREGRWGVALARQKMARRVLARRGPDRAFLAAGFLPDGRALVVGVEPPWLVGRELGSGREIWRFEHPEPVVRVTVAYGHVRVGSPDSLRYLDATSGRLAATFARREGFPCGSSPIPSRVHLTPVGSALYDLVVEDGTGAPRTLLTNLPRGGHCTVSARGDRLAALDSTGAVHVFDLAKLEEVATRQASDASQFLFTAHGVAVVRSGSLEVFGGEDGEYFIALPGLGGNGLMGSEVAGVASPDGHLVVLPRLTSNQVDVVDLRLRKIVSSLAISPGPARLAVSPSSDRLIVAGLLNGSLAAAWDIGSSAPRPRIAGSPRMAHLLSDDGQRILVSHVANPYQLEVRDAEGRLLQALEVGGQSVNAVLSPDGSRIAVFARDSVSVRDAASGAPVAELACEGCLRLHLSRDGRRLLTSNGLQIALWDVDRKQAIWRETARVGHLSDALDISRDGLRVAWGREGFLYIHTEGGGADQTIEVGDALEDARLSQDGRRLAVAGRQFIGVWDLDDLRPVFRVPNPASVAQEIGWSIDDSALINGRDALGEVLMDARTGERFATIGVSRPAAAGANDLVAGDLRHSIARGDGEWEVRLLPQPSDSPAEESLARVLDDAGLAMKGVEIVNAVPARR